MLVAMGNLLFHFDIVAKRDGGAPSTQEVEFTTGITRFVCSLFRTSAALPSACYSLPLVSPDIHGFAAIFLAFFFCDVHVRADLYYARARDAVRMTSLTCFHRTPLRDCLLRS